MDLSGALKSEVVRPLISLVMPGLAAAFPFSFVSIHYYPNIYSFATEHATLATVLGFVVSLGFGLLSRELGLRFENVIDTHLKKTSAEHMTEWYQYLRCRLPDDLVARRYIHDQVLFLQFELNIAASFIISSIGFLWLYCIGFALSTQSAAATIGGLLAGAAYFLWEAGDTAKVLARVRKEILKGFGEPPLPL